jgi:hypothetical protein
VPRRPHRLCLNRRRTDEQRRFRRGSYPVWVSAASTRRDQRVAGIQLSPGGMEDVLAAHPDVAECAVFGVSDAMKGRSPAAWWFALRRAPPTAPRNADAIGDLVAVSAGAAHDLLK